MPALIITAAVLAFAYCAWRFTAGFIRAKRADPGCMKARGALRYLRQARRQLSRVYLEDVIANPA
jgi:hypothetical protein